MLTAENKNTVHSMEIQNKVLLTVRSQDSNMTSRQCSTVAFKVGRTASKEATTLMEAIVYLI